MSKVLKGFSLVVGLVSLVVASPAAAFGITTDGISPITVGAQYVQIRSGLKRSDTSVTYDATFAERFACDTFDTLDGSAYVMVELGVVTTVSTTSTQLATNAGIRVGTSENALRQAYGSRLEVKLSDSSGDFFYIFRSTSGHGLKFNVSNGLVSEITAGKYASLLYAEGCL